jgi:hypothetical protein
MPDVGGGALILYGSLQAPKIYIQGSQEDEVESGVAGLSRRLVSGESGVKITKGIILT